jgi:peptidyl-prolyl cis-trans isomerase B (cyclophilin B)
MAAHPIAAILMLASMLIPARVWTPPAMPLLVNVKATEDCKLVLMDFNGNEIPAKGSPQVSGEKQVDVKDVFPALARAGGYVLFLVPKGKPTGEFEGTPLVIEARPAHRQPPQGPPEPEVYKMEPLRYADMKTEKGDMLIAFYFDVAPNTADQFLRLSEEGYYNDLTFHRILPGFVLQGGDPLGDGRGGPGYHIQEEFNSRPHEAGVLSMAREGDPAEGDGSMPGPEFANSAGTQFFICLDYANTKHLDNRYTAFGKVMEGMSVANALAQTPLSDARAGTPVKAPKIISVDVKPVTASDDPYAEMLKLTAPATQPASPDAAK